MTDQATRIVPAGWYEDPASHAHVRWWNGLAWTEHTSLKPTEPVSQPVQREVWQQEHAHQDSAQQDSAQQRDVAPQDHVDASAARIAQARELERQYGISTAENDVIMRAARGGVVEDHTYRPEWGGHVGAHHAQPTRTATASSWFIALWPVLTLAALAAAAYVYFYLAANPIVLAAAAVPFLLTLIWAIADVRKLRRFGHQPASAGFAALGPFVYLVARRARVKGTGPLAVFIVLFLLSAGGPVAALNTGAATPVLTALEIQQAVSTDLVGNGSATNVSCPFFIESTRPGTLYTCSATLASGAKKSVWVSIDSFDGDFSYALSVR